MTEFTMTIGGKQVGTEKSFDVLDPSTGALVGKAPQATRADLDAAVAAASEAFKTWSQTSDQERVDACMAVAKVIEDNAEELAQILTAEQGKPLNGVGSRWEMEGAVGWTQATASFSVPVKTIQDDNEAKIELHRKPIGVVGSITPWNFPVLIAIWHIIPALRTGNTVVIKPSPHTPLATLRLMQLIDGILPDGVVNCVTASDDSPEQIGAAMSGHEGIGKIVFTGSCGTGQKIMQSSAETMKRLTLELGGNDAAIVLGDVDPAEIAENLFWGAFVNSGQTCAALKRLYVHEDVYDGVCEALTAYAREIPMGDGRDENAIMGPIQNQMQFNKVKRLVDDAVEKGRVLLGGKPDEGLFFPLTLVADLDHSDPLVAEEQFGPALPIVKFSDVEDALRMANDSPNGLGGSVWSKDIEKARELALRMECGMVWVNNHASIRPDVPFGGVKGSGFGVEFGEEGLQEFTNIQAVFS